jgi:hypothetical protein
VWDFCRIVDYTELYILSHPRIWNIKGPINDAAQQADAGFGLAFAREGYVTLPNVVSKSKLAVLTKSCEVNTRASVRRALFSGGCTISAISAASPARGRDLCAKNLSDAASFSSGSFRPPQRACPIPAKQQRTESSRPVPPSDAAPAQDPATRAHHGVRGVHGRTSRAGRSGDHGIRRGSRIAFGLSPVLDLWATDGTTCNFPEG